MSLLLAYTFNEQSATPWDYSGNKWTGAAHNLSFVAGQSYGYAASLGGSSPSYISVAPTSFTGLGSLSVFSSFNLISLPAASGAYLVNSSSFYISINSSGAVTFGITLGTSGFQITSSSNLSTGWNTVGCIYDGTQLYIYINGILESTSNTAAGALASPSAIFIGAASATDSSTYITAYIDSIEFRSTALAASDVAMLNANPGGLSVTQSPHNFAVGDLISDGTRTYQGIVTWVVNADAFYFYPVTAIGGTYSRLGNIGNTARQYYMEFITDFDGNGNGQIKWTTPIAGFSDYGSASAATFTLDYRGASPNPYSTQNVYAITSLKL